MIYHHAGGSFFGKEQDELKKTAFLFALRSLSSRSTQRDKHCLFPRRSWKAAAAFGIPGLLISKKYGGRGLDPLSACAILEGIGKGCKDSGLIFSACAHLLGCGIPIFFWGTEIQKKKYLPRLCSGSMIGAHAMTETESGSNVFDLKTEAVKEGNFYILKGHKVFVTNAPIADLFLVYARTGQSKGLISGISCFIVEKRTPGLKVGKKNEKMGLRTSPMAEVSLDYCKIPSKNLLGRESHGGLIFSQCMEWERAFILASCIGVMERQLEQCLEYVRSRKQKGVPIGTFQSVAHKIAEMSVRLETSRLLIHKVAWLKSLDKHTTLESAMAKLHVSESYIQNCRDAVELHGANGYISGHEWERDLRDALASTIYSGTSQIQKNIISRFLI